VTGAKEQGQTIGHVHADEHVLLIGQVSVADLA
jgi:hypothetical protein